MYVLELGGEDDAFAAYEAASACAEVTPLATGLATARGVSPAIERLAFTHATSRLMGTCNPSVDDAVRLIEAAGFDRTGTVAVRARDVRGSTGVSTREAERALGDVLVDRGFAVDLDEPDHELRALFAQGQVPADDSDKSEGEDDEQAVCALGWLEREREGGFGRRVPTEKPFFQPGSMDPLLARALVNVAGAGPGAVVLDPMCGTGGVLVEAGLVGARTVGVDAQAKMAHGARENLQHYLDDAPAFDVGCGDATRLPVADDAVDTVVFDAPYGRQSHVASRSTDDLLQTALAEAYRVAPRAVVVGDQPWRREARDAGWRVDATFERRVHRSLVRHVHVLDRY